MTERPIKEKVGIKIIGLETLNEKLEKLSEHVAEVDRLANEIASATLTITSEFFPED